ncbi:MAG: hypothetical protein M1503_02810 [Thaumarchaeota archaeon]|nr:hypothetical protein [Nitrososphaerota archaeon]MCL5317182.1 hypothetical protein [Nitrososphaerota archaeon]
MVTQKRLRRLIDLAIYLSVALGVLFIAQISGIVPQQIVYALLTGWVAYLFTAVAVVAGRREAYSVAFILVIITLLVSLPEPRHYTLINSVNPLPCLTFIGGSALQITLVILLPIYFWRGRHPAEPV